MPLKKKQTKKTASAWNDVLAKKLKIVLKWDLSINENVKLTDSNSTSI